MKKKLQKFDKGLKKDIIKTNMERIPKNFLEKTPSLGQRREHPHEDLSKIDTDFEQLGRRFGEVFEVARETAIARTLGTVDSTLEKIKEGGIIENFPGLEARAAQLHQEADAILNKQ